MSGCRRERPSGCEGRTAVACKLRVGRRASGPPVPGEPHAGDRCNRKLRRDRQRSRIAERSGPNGPEHMEVPMSEKDLLFPSEVDLIPASILALEAIHGSNPAALEIFDALVAQGGAIDFDKMIAQNDG